MRIKNNTDLGFTLVELLAIITLLGIILVITIPLILGLVKTASTEEMASQEQTLKLVGEDYFLDERAKLPKVDGEIEFVYLVTLIDEGYIKEIKDDMDNVCDTNLSYVSVTRKGINDYEYKAYLLCEEYETEE